MNPTRNFRNRRGVLAAVTIASLSVVAATPVLTADRASAAPGPQARNLTITAPVDGAVLPPGTVDVRGTLGSGSGAEHAVVFALDVSGSTSSPRQDCTGDSSVGAADDLNGDGTQGDVLDCEIAGALALVNSLAGRGDVRFGLVAFGSRAASADVSSVAGVQDFAGSGGVDELITSLESFRRGSIGSFAPRSVSTSTVFSDPLVVARQMFEGEAATRAASGNATPVNEAVFFLSDGQASITATNSAVTGLAARGATVNTYAIGSGAGGCGPTNSLRVISDNLSGTCTVVQDPSTLSAAITGTVTAPVEVTLRDLGAGGVVDVRTVTASGIGEWRTPFDGLQPGSYEAIARSGGLTASVTFTIEAAVPPPTTQPTPTTAVPTTAPPTTVAPPTTAAPTTVAPSTTAAPTTVAPSTTQPMPTTAVPTTAAPTTQPVAPSDDVQVLGEVDPGSFEVAGLRLAADEVPQTMSSTAMNLALTGGSTVVYLAWGVALVGLGAALSLIGLAQARRTSMR